MVRGYGSRLDLRKGGVDEGWLGNGGEQVWVLNPKYFLMTSVPSLSAVLGAEFQAVL